MGKMNVKLNKTDMMRLTQLKPMKCTSIQSIPEVSFFLLFNEMRKTRKNFCYTVDYGTSNQELFK